LQLKFQKNADWKFSFQDVSGSRMARIHLKISRITNRLAPLIIVLAVLYHPFGSSAHDGSLPENQRILKSASELDYPPLAVVQPDGSAGGFSVDLLKAAAEAVGLSVSFKIGPWYEIKEELASGALDVLPLAAYSAERHKVYDFTAPYLRMNGAVFVRKDNTDIHELSDLIGKEVLVMQGDTAHEYVVKEKLSDNIIPTISYEEAFKLLAAGKHDAVVVQQIIGLQILKNLGITNIIPVQQKQISTLKPVALELEGFEQKFCFAVTEGNSQLLSQLNEGLTIVTLNGTYESLYEKWLGPILPKPQISADQILKNVLFILVPLLLIFALIGIWSLKRLVAKKTRFLEEEILQRRQTEEVLRKREGHFRTLVQTIPDLIWLKDKGGVYLACNPLFEGLYGAREADIIGKTDYDFVDQKLADFFVEHDRKAMAAGKPTRNEEWLTFADDGHRALYETIKTPMYDDRGALIGVLGVGRDITERKKLAERLQQAQKLEAIGVLTGGIFHDFNNILSAILGFTELARDNNPSNQQLQEDLNEIYIAGNRAKELVQQILTFSRQQKFDPCSIHTPSIIKQALNLLHSTLPATVEMEVDIDETAGPVFADPAQLHQIIINLFMNASEAMENCGGILTIKVSETTSSDQFFSNHPDLAPGRYIKLHVQDTGTGIAPEIKGSIFDPYFTTKNLGDGTGLGLAVTYGIIKEMGGDIMVESEPGKGSIFTIFLPVTDQEVQ